MPRGKVADGYAENMGMTGEYCEGESFTRCCSMERKKYL
jgi:hypothetical protein